MFGARPCAVSMSRFGLDAALTAEGPITLRPSAQESRTVLSVTAKTERTTIARGEKITPEFSREFKTRERGLPLFRRR